MRFFLRHTDSAFRCEIDGTPVDVTEYRIGGSPVEGLAEVTLTLLLSESECDIEINREAPHG